MMQKRGKIEGLLRKYGKPAGILFLIYFFASFALLQADFYFRDDLRRAAIGFRGWGIGRYLSLLFSVLLHTDTYLADISPLPQLLALLILAVSGIVLYGLLSGRKPEHVRDFAALFPLAFFPSFLNCLSYKYDAPYMALSVCVSIVPLTYFRRRRIWFFSSIFLGTLTMCMLYQASSGYLPMLVIFLALEEWLQGGLSGRGAIRFMLFSAVPYGAAMIIFRLLIMKPMDTYVSTALPPARQLIPTLLSNYRRYFSCFFSDLRPIWLILLGLLTVLYLIRTVRSSIRGKALTLLWTITALAGMWLLSLGAYPLLEKPLFLPRAMYGLGFPFTLMGIELCLTDRKKAALAHLVYGLVLMAVSFCFLIFAYVYGNALTVQAKYTDFRASLALSDINELEAFASDEEKTVELSGDIGFSPLIQAMPEDYRLLRRLVPHTLGKGNMWRQYGFFHYYGLKNTVAHTGQNLSAADLPLLKETMYHQIRGDGRNFLVIFK